ncbi:hypothetical protein Pmani_031671 [Petrolisthes manimaculis]|uniref:BTB domain-containing protein n=1 Tax=Petrolisthes manimaculis TaxID=1843537 RepID=A0AAE1NUQ0_9EUCA|nr:hypothetical protein Pmani_031671 [Petrolisthes manimaculis]
MVEQHFCLRWNNYRTNITAEFETLREGEHFVDVTLACDGRQLKAHKVVLSACSPYFKELLQGNPCTHPIIILRDVAYTHMRSLLEFMYAGEVNISQVQLAAFLHTAEALKIRGLAESSDDRKDQGGLNSMSPLSALKTSLGSLGGLGLSNLGGPSILERPLVPQLLPHHVSPDKPGGPPPLPTPHHLPPHLVPPPLATLSAPPPQTPGPPSTSSTSSTSSLTLATPPLPLGVVVGAGDQRTPRPDPPPDRTPSPPTPLPPSKRLRKSLAENPPPPPPLPPPDSHGDPGDNHAMVVSAPITTTSAPITVLPPEDLSHPILKTEPVESCGSDVEGGGAWCSPDDGGEVGGGGGCGVGGGGLEPMATRTPPGPTPPGGTPPPQHHPTPTDNTSHLLQALSSESHLQVHSLASCAPCCAFPIRHILMALTSSFLSSFSFCP